MLAFQQGIPAGTQWRRGQDLRIHHLVVKNNMLFTAKSTQNCVGID